MQIVKSFSKVNFMNLGGTTDFSPLLPGFQVSGRGGGGFSVGMMKWDYILG